MPRKPRTEAPYAIHHVVAKGNGGENIVRDDRDRRMLIGRIARSVEIHGWACPAFCVLDNHFHLVVQTPRANLGAGMKWLKAAYAQDFNHRHDRYGHVFGGRFYSVVVERDSHLVSAIVYVALNPVRAGLAARPEHWPWSSYAALIGRAPGAALPRSSAGLRARRSPAGDCGACIRRGGGGRAELGPAAEGRRGGSDPWVLTRAPVAVKGSRWGLTVRV